MFRLIKKMSIGSWTGIVTATNHAEFISLSDEKCTIQTTIINLHPNEYT